MDVGEEAPDFVLPDQNGTMLRFSGIAPGKTRVVFFYPKDGSPICTREACSFRDSQRLFQAVNAQVIGISADSADSHQRFAARNHLDFPLLSDTGGKVRRLWRVPSTLGVLPGRVTYVVDARGVTRRIHSGQLDAAKHVQAALDAATALAARTADGRHGREP